MTEKRAAPGLMRPFGPGPGRHHLGGPVQKAGDTRGVLRRLWGYLRPYAVPLAGVSLLVVATTVLSLLNPYLTSRADDGTCPATCACWHGWADAPRACWPPRAPIYRRWR